MSLHPLPLDKRVALQSALMIEHGADDWADIATLAVVERACDAAVQSWWDSASTDEALTVIEAHPDARVQTLCALLCAESVGHLTDDPRVVECRRVTLAWVRGHASDRDRVVSQAAAQDAAWAAARAAARAAAQDAARAASRDASRDASRGASRDAAWDAARAASRDASRGASRGAACGAAWTKFAAAWRCLIEQPGCIDLATMHLRWDAAVLVARGLFTGGAV